MGKITITEVKDLNAYNNKFSRLNARRNNIVIHDGWQWHLSSSNNFDHIKELLEILGIKYSVAEEEENMTLYNTDVFYKSEYFWSIEKLPKNATKIKGLSNGSIVDCYFTNIDNVLTVYRPNPNNKDVYKPLPLKEHIEYCKNNPHI